MCRQTNQNIFDATRQYLLAFVGVTEEILNAQLSFPESDRPRSKSALFKRMIDHAKNRRSMPNSIGDCQTWAMSV